MAENYFGQTDTGRVRSNNEDTFVARKVMHDKYVLAAVIDGVGGYNGGEVAAEIAQTVFTEQLSKPQANIIEGMIEAFKQASRDIAAKKAEDKALESMACVATMAIADIENNRFYYAHVGDTRLYLLRDQSLVKISKDHSFVGFLEDSGRLTEDAAMNHPKRNEINKALGFSNQVETDDSFVETGDSPFLPGDLLLLCSDGLTDLVDKEGILSILTLNASLQEKARELITAANNNGGRDNVTVVLVHNDKPRYQPQAVAPVTNQVKRAEEPEENKERTNHEAIKPSTTKTEPQMRKSGNSGLTVILGLLCLLFLGSTVWLFMKGQTPAKVTKPIADTAKLRNDNEVKLQDAIDAFKGDTLVLTDTAFKQPVMLTDTLHIDKDTLYLKTKGNFVLQRDTAYHGPALALGGKAKVIVIENLKFKDFDVAVEFANNGLSLVNVQFSNCRLPVRNNYVFAQDKNITASFPMIITNTNTAKPKTTAKANGGR
ncbi:serine/threonine-protein phosphatase [Mucilaginibacter achroorhodeus]|uniref:Serine/threonine-protein phosphatase n=1 Tax=Mucilaginibacter achroorhodeus TaxID=2599294 RepID=A0A563U2N2_9SPHI|nr:protein phosphatase 2C domain-containing protein [Mucilaginibacter achroorhodeus]TWR25589.1 serine/threonine-protein phosphatase [Mucilaginibacter achroorhodeus]